MNTPPPSSISDRLLDRLAEVVTGPPLWVRALLATVAFAQLLIALPWLVGIDPLSSLGNTDEAHLTRDGAFGIAIATAGLITAWRHRYAIAAAILSGALLLLQTGTAMIDGQSDRVAWLVEAAHVPVLVIVGLIIYSARPERAMSRPRRPQTDTDITDPQSLRLVPPARDE